MNNYNKSEIFSDIDIKREKSHQLNIYPDEKSYSPKSKITSYKFPLTSLKMKPIIPNLATPTIIK